MFTSETLSSGFPPAHQGISTQVRKLLPEDLGVGIVEMSSGVFFNILNPRAEDVRWSDICLGLSRLPRYLGQTKGREAYTVAEHSVWVSKLAEFLVKSTNARIPSEIMLACDEIYAEGKIGAFILKVLLHDAHETYIGDIPSPIKKISSLHETIKLIEDRLDSAIFSAFSLKKCTLAEKKVIKYCDLIARAVEANSLMPSQGKNWNGLPDYNQVEIPIFNSPLCQAEAHYLLHDRFISLSR